MAEAQQVIAVVVLAIVGLIGVAIFSPLVGIATDMGTSSGDETINNIAGNDVHVLDSAVTDTPSTFSASPTRGNAVSFDGDGYLEDNISDLESGDWSIAVTAELADGANEQAAYSLVAVENASILVEYYDGDWRAINYQDGESAAASVSAADPFEMTGVVVSWDNTAETLTIYADAGSDSGGLTSDSPDRTVANDWLGTVDEVRVIDGAVSQQTAEAYNDDPIQPLADEDHHARFMLDEGAGDETHVYYAGTSATIVNGQWTSGVDSPELEEGVDYEIGSSPLSVTFVEGGYFDGAPVAYVTWDSGLGGSVGSVIGGVDSAMQMLPIVMLVMLASLLVALLARFR